MTPRSLPLALAGLAALSVAPTADAAKRKLRRMSATYMTTIKVSYEHRWQYAENATNDCLPGVCTREDKGSGSTTAFMRTKAPFPVWVLRGSGGRPPTINLGSDGIPMAGSQLVQGTDTLTYGGPWTAANPDVAKETSGCGRVTAEDFGSIGWESPGQLYLQAEVDPFREDCPAGPSGIEWEGGDSLSLQDVLATVGKGKFLQTKQFTVRGARTVKGILPTISEPYYTRSGDASTTIQWEATFRMKGARKRQR